MDIEDWEVLPHGGFIDYHEGEENKYSTNSNPKSKFNMNYFVCPSSPPRMLIQPNRVVPVPFQLEPTSKIEVLPSMGPDLGSKEPDQDPISQVFFKKLKENELFVDMKMDSPKSPKKGLIVDAGKFDFQDLDTKICSPRIKNQRVDEEEEEEEKGLNLWKWSLSGIGAIWSFGFAAATVCVIVFGSQQRVKLHDHKHKIYADDKKIEKVVHNATKMNETIGAVRGVPINKAHITYGGYYEGL